MVKKGQRRGPYRKKAAAKRAPSRTRRPPVRPPRAADELGDGLTPSPEDLEWMKRIIAESPIHNIDVKTMLAEALLNGRLLLRDLRSGRALTVDEMKLIPATMKKSGELAALLKITVKVRDDDDDDDDEEDD